MTDITVWERIKEAIQALGGKGTYLEITEHILSKWPGTDPNTIRSEIIACTVNHHTRIHYKAKEPGIANRPYDFLYQPKRGIGYVEWYEPDKHGIWGNKRGEDGKLYVTRFDDEQAALMPRPVGPSPVVPSLRKVSKRENPPCPASHGDRLGRLIEALRSKLDLSELLNPEEYAYQSLPLCILDAVFSINAKYESTRNVVERYCRHYRLRQVRKDPLCLPPVEEQEPVSAFVEKVTQLGPEKFAGMVLANRQRTSTKSGIMKSEAALRFAQVLKLHKVEYFQDVEKIQGKEDFENAVMAIPGQHTGITVRYFYMLAGSDDFVKPDRMILGFLRDQLGERLSQDEAQGILSEASDALKPQYPHLTTKTLDHHIWMYQREKEREITEAIRRFIGHFEAQFQRIKEVESPLFQKVLIATALDALSRATFGSSADGHRVRNLRLISEITKWQDHDRVSLPQLALVLAENKLTETPLSKRVESLLSTWEKGAIIPLERLPRLSDFQLETLEDDTLERDIESAQLGNLFYMYRCNLVHEFREPGYGMELDGEEIPYFHLTECSQWELVYPLGFFHWLFRKTLGGLKTFLKARGINPYTNFEFGSQWRGK